MILGLGTDLCDIRRIEKTLARHGARFLDRVFTPHEQARCLRRPQPAAAFAQRFAAKEACAKALGTGMRQGVAWRDIEVDNLPSGKPILRLAGGAARRLRAMTPEGYRSRLDVSLTDEYPLAHAIVIIFGAREPAPDPGAA